MFAFAFSSSSSPSKSSVLCFLNTSSIDKLKLLLLRSHSQLSFFVNNVSKTADVSSASTSEDLKSSSSLPSSSTRPTILVSEKLGEVGLQVLRDFGHVECVYDLSPEELCARIASCDVLIVRSETKVTRQAFKAGKGRLKVVGRAGVGIDNIDLQATSTGQFLGNQMLENVNFSNLNCEHTIKHACI